MSDETGNWPKWVKKVANWMNENIIQPVKEFVNNNVFRPVTQVINNVAEDINNYDKDNTSIRKVYDANYFSSYNGVFVIRNSSDFLTSWAFGGIINLNHNLDDTSLTNRRNTLNHEYGHILQERTLGTRAYITSVFIPSATFNLLSRISPTIAENYYNLPWEYDADNRGGVNRNHAQWAEPVSEFYFVFWGA